MPATVLEKTGEQIEETVSKAGRMTAKIGETLHERLDEAKLIAKRQVHAAEEAIDQTKLKIRKHPVETVVGTLIVGIATGMLLGWVLRRK